MNEISTVTVVGLGYIGLPTAAILASKGVEVHGVDVNDRTIEAINSGRVPFVEPDLASFVSLATAQGRLRASRQAKPADVFVIAVPTPFSDDRTPDLSYIRAAALTIAPHLEAGNLVVLESTSPPGTTAQLLTWILEARPDLLLPDGSPSISVAYCPERVLPGRVMVELVENDRIVGGLTPADTARAKALYEIFCVGDILKTDAVTAEMAKLTENSYRDVNIAFANELSVICDGLGVDVWELIRLANRHPRVNVLQPGPGVGGHCIAVDPWFIVAADPTNSRLIRTAREVNDDKPQWVLNKVVEAVAGLSNPRIVTLGLAFKPDIDDLRESPARKIVAMIADAVPKAELLVVEPHTEDLPPELANRRNIRHLGLDEALTIADCVVLLVPHRQFRDVPTLAEGTVLIDVTGSWTRGN